MVWFYFRPVSPPLRVRISRSESDLAVASANSVLKFLPISAFRRHPKPVDRPDPRSYNISHGLVFTSYLFTSSFADLIVMLCMRRRFQIDPSLFRVVLALLAVPTIALAIIALERLKASIDERRVLDYVRRVQPRIAADPRFKYVRLNGTSLSGCVSNIEVLGALQSLIDTSKPPFPISVSFVSTNANDWAWQMEHERLLQLDRQAGELIAKSDAFLGVFSDRFLFYKPENTNTVSTLVQVQAIVGSLQQRDRAVIVIPAVGYDGATNDAARAAAMLRQCGFKEIQVLTTLWGLHFPYTKL